jgi:hypothetical protein
MRVRPLPRIVLYPVFALVVLAALVLRAPASQPPVQPTRAVLQGSVREAPLRTAGSEATPSSPVSARRMDPEMPQPLQDTLSLIRSFGDSTSFGRPNAMVVLDSHLVVIDNLLPPFVSVMERSDGRFLFRFGRKGSGPGEFVAASWGYADPRAEGRVWVYDFQLRRLIGFDVVSADADPASFTHVSVNYAASLTTPYLLGDTLLANGLFPDYTLFIADRATSESWRILGRPPYGPPEMPAVVGQRLMNRNFLAMRPDENAFVLAYQFASKLDFFDRVGSLIRSVAGPVETTPRFHMADSRFFWDQGNEMAYLTVAAGRSYVYALFCGCALGADIQHTTLHVFDWNGRLVAVLEFPFPVQRIAVPPDEQTIFAAYEEPYPLIGEFALPTFRR